MLAKKLRRARKLRRLDPSRDTKSLQLYHHILWLSREGLSIVELDVLPYTQNGEQGHECRVMSCKLRASFYHIFCLFHNNPPVSTLSIPSQITLSPDNPDSPPQRNGQRRSSNGKNGSSRHGKKASLRDAIPSLQSDISYITNPYALTGATPPPQSQNPQTPSRPPGLPPKPPIPSSTAFILPPLNFLPITTSAFTTTSSLASSLLPGSHPLRLSVALEHSAFLWDCAKEFDRSRRVAYRAISDVWNADEGMDDVEFEDARELVSLLGGMMKRGLPKASSSGGTQGERSARDSGARSGTEDITAIRRGGEGARLASSPGRPTAASSRQSPPKQSRSSPPRRQDSRGTSSTTPKAATTPSRTTSRRSPPSRQDRGAPSNTTSKPTPTSSRTTQRRGSPSRQDRGVPSSTPPRPMTSGINTTRRSSPRRQESYGTASSTPRPPTAIRDSPHLRPPTADKDKELPPTPEEWTRIGYLGEPRYSVGRRGAHERTPPSAARISRGGSATSQHPNTPQARTPPTQLGPAVEVVPRKNLNFKHLSRQQVTDAVVARWVKVVPGVAEVVRGVEAVAATPGVEVWDRELVVTAVLEKSTAVRLHRAVEPNVTVVRVDIALALEPLGRQKHNEAGEGDDGSKVVDVMLTDILFDISKNMWAQDSACSHYQHGLVIFEASQKA
ncbi:MAG: hypothetical protein Q9157_003827 [Trypethelium eluteriae]